MEMYGKTMAKYSDSLPGSSQHETRLSLAYLYLHKCIIVSNRVDDISSARCYYIGDTCSVPWPLHGSVMMIAILFQAKAKILFVSCFWFSYRVCKRSLNSK